MSEEDRVSRVENAVLVNLNLAQNTASLTFVASVPIKLQRFGVIGGTPNGLLAPLQLKLRTIPIATGVVADLGTDILGGGALARGLGRFKNVTGDVVIAAGDTVIVAIETPAGGVDIGEVHLEFWELPFSGPNISAFVESTT